MVGHMGLPEIRAYLMQVRIASLAMLAVHFGCEPGLLRQMLAHWVRKGCVRCFTRTGSCGPCSKCPMASIEMYEWLG